MQTSFNSNEKFLSDTMSDALAVCPESQIILQEKNIETLESLL
ncbi:hypothetical protein [Apilactobacillus ozensis]|nr:hypothetical protein [Apilactobacillus ozensis]